MEQPALSHRMAGYRALFRVPGTLRLAAASLLAAVAGTMLPLSLLLFTRDAAGSFATAGLVLGVASLGGVSLGPARGRLVDRRGPSVAIVVLAVPAAITDLAFLLAGRHGAPTAALVALAFVAGAIVAPVGIAWRTVWAERLKGDEARNAGFGLMTMVQETSFLAGPLLVAAIVAAASTTAALAATAGLALVGALTFAVTVHASAPAVRAPATPVSASLLTPGLWTLIAASGCFGAAFGALDVALPALARHEGSPAAAGVLLAALAAGIWIGGLLWGLSRAQGPQGRRFPALALLAAAGTGLLVPAWSIVSAGALAVLAGLCIAPATACQLGVIDEVTPEGRRAEAFASIGASYGTGVAIGAAACGQLVAGAGVRVGLIAALAAASAAATVALFRRRSLVPASPR